MSSSVWKQFFKLQEEAQSFSNSGSNDQSTFALSICFIILYTLNLSAFVLVDQDVFITNQMENKTKQNKTLLLMANRRLLRNIIISALGNKLEHSKLFKSSM